MSFKTPVRCNGRTSTPSSAHRAVVIGHDHMRKLKHNNMTSPDIRAGIAMLIAAMAAEGTSRIDNIDHIDRGYEDIEDRLNAIGASIRREE